MAMAQKSMAPLAMRIERSPKVQAIASSASGCPSSPNSPVRTSNKPPAQRRLNSLKSSKDDSGVRGRVRVAIRLRPRNADELIADAGLGDCAELQPELKRLRLRKSNLDSEIFQFDEVLNETSSQKRVYEVVAKPVVESVLEGYNGTIMAYGQTGTGKTFTLGKIGEKDDTDRGIMVRAMEEILSDTSSEQDSVSMSYLQLYMETVQDLLAPERDNIAIVEDPKTGDVSVPGATVVEVRGQNTFISLLQLGEANRIAANTKMNTESSRSHAILLVNIKKTVKLKEDAAANDNGGSIQAAKLHRIRRSKLLIVDLAGSERVNKAGSDGHLLEEAKFINLSLTALGKCINALAENSSHVPIRDSKLTRLLRDSFGGTARTSLIITIGPSPHHRAETTSTILFGQRAMKVENMIKLKEEFDYQSLSRKLETELDRLIEENERRYKALCEAEEELERSMEEARNSVMEAEMKLSSILEGTEEEKNKLLKQLMDVVQKFEQEHALRLKKEEELHENTRNLQEQEKKIHSDRARIQQELANLKQRNQEEIVELTKEFRKERVLRESLEKKLQEAMDNISKHKIKSEAGEPKIVADLRRQLEMESQVREQAEAELNKLKYQAMKDLKEESKKRIEFVEQKIEEQIREREKMEAEIESLKQQLVQSSFKAEETRAILERQGSGRSDAGSNSLTSLQNSSSFRDTANGQRTTITKLFEQVGLQKILSLLESDDLDVQIHAVKVLANLAAEEKNQEKILEAGGLSSLIALLKDSGDETIKRVSAGAIANLAMNESNQELVVQQGGVKLLAQTANEAVGPQTLRMVAGAIANLCGNEKMQGKLREEGGIKALLGMVKSKHSDVLMQVARGIANFAKCESRGISREAATMGKIKGSRSMLIDEGALPWIIANVDSESSQIRRHTELALCHLAQHEANGQDLVSAGAVWELVRISRECNREDIRNLAKRILNGSQCFETELRRLHVIQ